MVERSGWKAIEIIAEVSRFASQRPCSAQAELAGKRGEAPRFPCDRQGHPQPIGTIKAKLTLIMLRKRRVFYKETYYLPRGQAGKIKRRSIHLIQKEGN